MITKRGRMMSLQVSLKLKKPKDAVGGPSNPNTESEANVKAPKTKRG